MIVKKQEHSYSDDVHVDENGNCSSQVYDEKPGNNLQVNASNREGSTGKLDPFGDETNAEIKYRTMAWWSVSS